MKVIVGVDLKGECSSAVSLLARLRFPDVHATLIHAIEPVPAIADGGYFTQVVETEEVFKAMREGADAALKDTSALAVRAGFHPNSIVCEGFPVATIGDEADRAEANLIAVTTTVHGAFDAVFGGSVARGLAISAQRSLLVARGSVGSDGPVSAVFATDHSPYCDACLERLLSWKPGGLGKVTVLTACHISTHGAMAGRLAPQELGRWNDELRDRLRLQNDSTLDRLKRAGIEATSSIIDGDPVSAIGVAMAETGAEMLIVGAQGHGFVRRLILGSTSLHEVIHGTYPVFIVRQPSAATS